MAALLSFLAPSHLALYWLCLARVGGLFAVAPALSDSSVPPQVRAALSVLIALAVMPAARLAAPVPTAIFPYVALLAGEVVTGLVIGFIAMLVFSMAEMAGELIDLQMGFSLGNLIDPVYGEATSVIGSVANILAMLLFLLGGGFQVLVLAVAHSYVHLPIGGAGDFTAAAGTAVSALGWSLLTAVEVAAPALALGVVCNLLLGLVGRAMPQLNILQIALPVQVIGGISALAVGLPIMLSVFGGLPLQTAGWLGRLLP